MIKKGNKILILAIILFFIFITPSFAREMSVSDIGKEIKAKYGSYGAYIIGDYVFTSEHILTTQDIMLAARSINVKDTEGKTSSDNIYKEMTIHYILEDWSTGEPIWKVQDNVVGETELSENEKFDINYIDDKYELEIVDTDKLLEDAEQKVESNNRYNVKFDKNTSDITFTVLDKNAEISKDEIAKIIVDILNETYVKSITIGNTTISKEDVKQENDDNIWSKVEKELKTLVSNNENEKVILGDLIEKNLTLTITVDDTNAHTHKENTSETYTIKFEYKVKAIIDKNIPEKDKDDLKNQLKYKLEDTYNIQKIEDGLYKVTGNVTEQENVEGFGENASGFYFAFTITLDNNEIDASKAKVKIPTDSTGKNYNEATFDTTTRAVTVLMEVEESEVGHNAQNGYRDIIVEVDGVPTKIRIDFSELTFLYAHEVSFKGIEADSITVWDGEKITEDMFPQSIEPSDNYHEFAYWNKEDGTKVENITIDKNTGDIVLVPHWNLNSDQFIADVIDDLRSSDTTYSQDFTNKFDLVVDKNDKSKITIDVKNPDTLLSEMNSTSIPGTIAYALNKDEIQEISLQVVDDTDDYTTTFNKEGVKPTSGISMASEVQSEVLDLKEKVQKGAKDLFTKVLQDNNKNEEDMTLSEMATGENPSFKIKIETTDETITLVGNDKAPIKEYTFTFKSDVLTVRNESTLKEALAKQGVKTIYIGENFNVTSSIEITNGDVTIIGGGHTLTATNQTSVFTVKSKNVAINNLTLNSQKEGIIVDAAGELKSNDLTVTACTEAGITVKLGGTLTGEKFTRENEKYDYPLVRAEKPQKGKKANINIIDSQGKEATATTIEIVEKYNKEEQQQGNAIGDKKQEKTDYNYVHYFNQSDIAKRWIKIVYIGDRAITHYPMTFTIYYDKENEKPNDNNIEPPENINYLTTYSNSLATFTVANWMDGITKYAKGSVPVPNSDTYYSAELKAEYNATTKEVTNEEELKDAVKADSTYKVVIIKQEITLNNVLDIKKEGLMITGAEAGTTEIKGTIKGEIKVTANKVTFDHINITGKKTTDEVEDKPNVVTINGDNFYSNGVKYSAESLDENNKYWNSILHYNGEDPTTIVYFGNFAGTNVEKMIEFVSEIDENTRIIGNNFEGANETKEFILIDKLKENAKVEIRQQTATFVGQNEYGIRIEAPKTATTATISLGEFWKKNTEKDVLKIAIDVTDTEYDTSKYTFEAGNAFKDKIKIVYVKNGEEYNNNPQGKNYNAKLMIGGVLVENSTVPETATIEGLKLNGDTYLGTLNQSEDGRFYLPVTLTSNDFRDNVSTVKVTNPNGEENTYTYSLSSNNGIATVINENTMKLQLEAIKSSKIIGNNGKVYKLELDADGNESNDYEVKEYIINYSEVETLEEKINTAAQKTLEATSFTVTKNNKINGYTEEFTYQYNAEDGLTYLKSDKDNVEEYTFSVKYAGVTDGSSKVSVVARKKKANEEDSKVYLNDWVYVHPLKTGRAIQEVTMLTDVMKDSKNSINAIDTVELVEGKEHKYTVKLNGDKYTDWVKNNYLLTSKYTITQWGETVLVDVELDENDQYIKSIKTHQESSSNTFDVTFTNVNSTDIKKPTEFLAVDGKELTDADIKKFYEDGRKWWDKHIYENAYKQ